MARPWILDYDSANCAIGATVGILGERPTFLHATDAGRPVYARMGYATVSTHTAFMEKRFLEGQ